jgi:hypothetical protein
VHQDLDKETHQHIQTIIQVVAAVAAVHQDRADQLQQEILMVVAEQIVQFQDHLQLTLAVAQAAHME